MNKIVLVTGGFDPIHSGHIAFLKAAKKLGGHLVVGVNSDAWLCRKKGKAFISPLCLMSSDQMLRLASLPRLAAPSKAWCRKIG